LVAQNTIIAHNAVAPITVDSLSSVTVDYSLSDGTALAGTGNVVADPLFTSPAGLNYQLLPGSPAIDAGNPSHPPDSDGTQPDIGARYVYSAADYPFTIGETVVINEVMANSGVGSDWIELHNRTSTPMDVSGWFLSDDGADLRKYRLGAGTDCLPHLPAFNRSMNWSPVQRGSIDVAAVAFVCLELLDPCGRFLGVFATFGFGDLVEGAIDIGGHAGGIAADIEDGALFEPSPEFRLFFEHPMLDVNLV
jgi:Lamin Tail Domain